MNHSVDYLKRLLSGLQEKDITAAIAGGYLRDLDHGIESKDLDIFVLSNGAEFVRERCVVDGVLEDGGFLDEPVESGLFTFEKQQGFENSASGSNMRDDVIGVKKYYDHELDFVFMDALSFNHVSANFDANVCQIVCRLDFDTHLPLEERKLQIFASDSYISHKRGGNVMRFLEVPTCDGHIERIRAKFGMISWADGIDQTLTQVGEITEEGIVYDSDYTNSQGE